MSYKRLFIVILFLCMALSPAHASKVTIARILREHRIHVVTTEKSDDISKYALRLGVRNETYMATTNLLIEKGTLKDKDSLLFVIDREKARRLIPEEAKLFPCPVSAVDKDEVILYAAKAAGRNGWDILVSAPDEKWLDWELDRLCKYDLDKIQLEERGSILDRYQVKRLCIISNENRQLAADWVSRQLKPGKDTIDWQFFSPDSNDIDPDMDRLYIINSSTIDVNAASLAGLPYEIRSWLQSKEKSEIAAEKQTMIADKGQSRTISAIAAPCTRQLESALVKYGTVDSIPEALSNSSLADLAGYKEMIVIARAGDRSDKIPTAALDDLAGKMTSALAQKTGMACYNRQDLKELVYMALLHQNDGNLDSNDIVQIRKQSGGARALAIVDAAAFTTRTDYSPNTPRCCTSQLAPFGEREPSRPHEPDPNERKFGIFGAHKYDEVHGSRANDPDFIRDYEQWERDMRDYRRDHDRWERRKRDYEQGRFSHEMDWEVSIDSTQSAKISGNLRIYDLNDLDPDSAGKVVFSCSLNGSESKRGVYWSDHVVVVGEQNKPNPPRAPDSHDYILDQTITSEAFKKACEGAVSDLLARAIVPADYEETTERSAKTP